MATALLALALIGSCRDAALSRARLEEARAVWDEAGVTGYTIEVVLTDGRELQRRVTVAVEGGAIGRAAIVEDEIERRPTRAQAHPYTVQGLFGILEAEVGKERRRFVRAWFDPELGYPERIELGPLTELSETSSRLLTVERFEVSSPESAP